MVTKRKRSVMSCVGLEVPTISAVLSAVVLAILIQSPQFSWKELPTPLLNNRLSVPRRTNSGFWPYLSSRSGLCLRPCLHCMFAGTLCPTAAILTFILYNGPCASFLNYCFVCNTPSSLTCSLSIKIHGALFPDPFRMLLCPWQLAFAMTLWEEGYLWHVFFTIIPLNLSLVLDIQQVLGFRMWTWMSFLCGLRFLFWGKLNLRFQI